MAQGIEATQANTDSFVRQVVQQYRTKLLDLTNRNPLVNFRHSERSRSHIRVVDELPERLFGKLSNGKQLSFESLPDPDAIPRDETTSMFVGLVKRAKTEDQVYKDALAEIGPSPSPRQIQKIERELRNRVRVTLGMSPFQPTWEPAKRAREVGINPDYDLPAMNGEMARRHNDSKIQTLFFAEDLDRKLGGLRDAAHVLEKDAGFNALFCTFGYLEYYESDKSDEKRIAPLVFIPVALDRELIQQCYSYFIKSRNEDVEVNVALAERLKQMSVNLPGWEEDEQDENPLGTYLNRVDEAIAGKRDWKVKRYVTIGLFTFSTLAMYKDLDPERWPPDASLERRPVLRGLIAGAESSNIRYAEDYEIDSLQGPEPLLITDADSSQHSAVVDVLRSNSSQVIQGPPGTGKSQTITNIIAATLNEGRSVLFVAEKMAALEVVKKRLDAAGLEAFCLELHSSKTAKTAVTESLARRIELRTPSAATHLVRSNANALLAAKNELLYYVQRVNNGAGNTGLKVYDVLLGSAIRDGFRSDLPASITEARFANSLEISRHIYRQMLDSAETLEAQTYPLKTFGELASHPWRGLQNIEITELDETRLIALLSVWNDAIRALLSSATDVEQRVCTVLPATRSELEPLCRHLMETQLPPATLDVNAYQTCVSSASREVLRQTLERFQTLLECEQTISRFTNDLPLACGVGSGALRDAVVTLRGLAIETFTVSSVMILRSEQRQRAMEIAALEPFCGTLGQVAGVHELCIDSMRAIVAGLGLLGGLPRPLWSKRAPPVLDESNFGVLGRAAKQTTALRERQTELEGEFDLKLLPPTRELRTLGVALKASNSFAALFNSTCREAKRVYRSATRNDRKRRRSDMADGLLRCAQYLAEAETLAGDSALAAICGKQFAGAETPFMDLVEISRWATGVRQRLAAFGETGLQIRDFLFCGTIDQLDRLTALSKLPAFASLKEITETTNESGSIQWRDMAERARARAERLAAAVDIFERAAFRGTCSSADLSESADALESVERSSAAICGDGNALRLVGGSLDYLRQNLRSLTATLNYADDVSTWALPKVIIEWIFADPEHVAELQSAARGMLRHCAAVDARGEEVNALANLDAGLWCGTDSFANAPLNQLLDRNQRAAKHVSALRDYLNFLLAEDAACDQGIGPVLAVYSAVNRDYDHLSQAVEFVFYRSAAEAVLNADPQLRRHSGATHQELRKQFRALDREYLELRREQLASTLAERPCPGGNSYGPVAELTEYALIARIAGQTRPRIAVRDLVRRAGKAMQALKPCWMMSPMSVAQYLEPGKLKFDIVIMDEASQIRPEEALGGIARGEKAVIVGDQMQLPPTPFFQKLSTGEATDNDEFEEEMKQDSVLEAAAGRFHPSRRLKWHYRSEHASLIAFSNAEFYDNQLVAFPSPYYDHPEYGVSLVQTGGIYEAGANLREGGAVVDAAIEFMKSCPNQSLGIVAVNAKQAEFVREELDRRVALDAVAAAFVQRWEPTLESLFVKNLENVQGDERDVIFISTVYGKDRNGSFYQRFGPINGVYGHRRLNVLFTRAKKRVRVFTSMSPEDIQEEGKHWGVKVLKGYLQFARDGIAVTATALGECESEFEQWVLQVLRSHGYEGVPQVGVCGYRIDIAVRHPSKPGTFLCGVECDGATYHSARSARERDRLRQEILEKYGWKLYRIWSTDWFRNPSLQTKQLLTYLQQLHPEAART